MAGPSGLEPESGPSEATDPLHNVQGQQCPRCGICTNEAEAIDKSDLRQISEKLDGDLYAGRNARNFCTRRDLKNVIAVASRDRVTDH